MEASLPSWRTEEGLYCLGSRRPGQGVGFTQLLWEATLLGTDLELDTNLLSARKALQNGKETALPRLCRQMDAEGCGLVQWWMRGLLPHPRESSSCWPGPVMASLFKLQGYH